MMRTFFLLLSLFASAALADEVLIDFKAGTTKLGLFYQGDQTDKALDLETDHFKDFVAPGARNTQLMQTGEGFIVRSADFDLRIKVIVWKNTEHKTKDEYPYKLTLKNLRMDAAVELKLSDTGGYTWIESGTYITQLSDVEHDYEFHDNSGNTMLTIRLFPAADEL